jgi:hypothetical protein
MEESPFEFIPVEAAAVPESSRRTLEYLAETKADFRAEMIARGHSERAFETTYPRALSCWLNEDTCEAALVLAEYMLAVNSGLVPLNNSFSFN